MNLSKKTNKLCGKCVWQWGSHCCTPICGRYVDTRIRTISPNGYCDLDTEFFDKRTPEGKKKLKEIIFKRKRGEVINANPSNKM